MQTGPVSRIKHPIPSDTTTDIGRKVAQGNPADRDSDLEKHSPHFSLSSRPKSASSHSSIFVGGLPNAHRLDYTKLFQDPRPTGTTSEGSDEHHLLAKAELSGNLDLPISRSTSNALLRRTRPQSAPVSRSSTSRHDLNARDVGHAPSNCKLHAWKDDVRSNGYYESSHFQGKSVVRERVPSHCCKQETTMRPKQRPSSAGAVRANMAVSRPRPRPRSAGTSSSISKGKGHYHCRVEELDPDYIWNILLTKPARSHSTLTGRENKMREVAAKNNAMAW